MTVFSVYSIVERVDGWMKVADLRQGVALIYCTLSFCSVFAEAKIFNHQATALLN